VNRLSFRRQKDRAGWLAEVVAALVSAGGRLPEAARTLDVPESTLKRWVEDEPALQEARPDVPMGRKPKKRRVDPGPKKDDKEVPN